MFTFRKLRLDVLEKAKYRHHYLRLGQFVFNYMHGFYGVARDVKNIDGVDCYYRDDLVDEFLKCCVERINNKEENGLEKHKEENV